MSKKLTAYRVSGRIVEDLSYSKIFYIDQSQFLDQKQMNDAVFEMAIDDWVEDGAWILEDGQILDSFTINEIERID